MMTMLDLMDEKQIFFIRKEPDGTFIIEERCDTFYNARLSKDELRQLGQEIIALAESADDDQKKGE